MISLFDLYLNNPTEYSLFPYDYINKKTFQINIKGDSLIIFDKNNLLTYNFKSDFVKFDFNKGFKNILVNERIYKKFIENKKLKFKYKINKYIKLCKFNIDNLNDINLTKTNFIETTGVCYPEGEYCLFTTYFKLPDDYEDLNKIIDLKKYDHYTIWYELTLDKIENISSYDDLLNKIEEIKITKEKPSLLLHSCCGPCSSECLRMLYPYFDITILYYNPNIFPKEEYNIRLKEQYKIINSLGYDIKVITKEYNHNEYLNFIKGTELLGEKSKRCYLCYKQRLIQTAKEASNKYDYFTTTISISPYKVSKWLNEIGFTLEKEYNVKYLYSDFKLNNGYIKSIELSKKYGLYRQDYCGCEYSKDGN